MWNYFQLLNNNCQFFLVCGGLINNQTHGSINSPGYPGLYPHNRDCEWLIEVTPGKRIQLVFATFRIESHPNCSYGLCSFLTCYTDTKLPIFPISNPDYFQVRDGLEENAPILAFYCNSTLPPPIISSGPYLTIRFHTDDSSSDTGFHITFAEVPGILLPLLSRLFQSSFINLEFKSTYLNRGSWMWRSADTTHGSFFFASTS